MSECSRFPSLDSTIPYLICSYPTAKPALDIGEVNSTIQRAFDTWASVCNLSFPRVNQAPASGPYIAIYFGNLAELAAKFQIKFSSAPSDTIAITGVFERTTSKEIFNKIPVNIICNDSFVFLGPGQTAQSARQNSFFVQAANSLGSCDLYTALVHEIGHALGLGHSANPHSIMFPWNVLHTILYPVGTINLLSNGDAEALATRYSVSQAPSYPTVVPLVIVGSTFGVTNLNSSIPVRDFGRFCWGNRTLPPTPVMNGYYGAGYGYLSLHLQQGIPSNGLYVVGGGTLRPPNSGQNEEEVGAMGFPTALSLGDEYIVETYVRVNEWGEKDGDLIIVAQVLTNFAVMGDMASYPYFILSSATKSPPRPAARLRGFYTQVSTATFSDDSKYTAREWNSASAGATTQTVILSNGRTFAYEKSLPGSGQRDPKYDNAYSFTYLILDL